MRYRLRTLLILMAVGPPIAAVLWSADRAEEFVGFANGITNGLSEAVPVCAAIIFVAYVASCFAGAVTGKR